MAREFEIRREVELPATPEEIWEAVATGPGNGGWLWPMKIEPGVGSAAEFGTVTAWDPARHLAVRVEGENGWFNALEFLIEARDGGTAVLRYMHSGIFVDDWDNQYDSADAHTDFYLHTLGQYLRYFPGRTATYVAAAGPPASAGANAFEMLRQALGLTAEAGEGDTLRFDVPGVGPMDAVVDYLTPQFVGLRTSDGLLRFFGRNAWGMPVGVSLHLFAAGIDPQKTELAWQAWLDEVLGA
jgi:hypothetical protein